ncbi:MAG: T9SS type A sorting domain-containing protein [Flavobacteriales bacterium]|nr:T9SS type A sorting domain-containing protein [Flavobacteriales bacterium]
MVSPNPTTGLVSISGIPTGADRTVRVSDMTGRAMDAPLRVVGNELVIDLSGAPAGSYLVQMGSKVFRVMRE